MTDRGIQLIVPLNMVKILFSVKQKPLERCNKVLYTNLHCSVFMYKPSNIFSFKDNDTDTSNINIPEFEYYELVNWIIREFLLYAVLFSQFFSWFCGSIAFTLTHNKLWNLLMSIMFGIFSFLYPISIKEDVIWMLRWSFLLTICLVLSLLLQSVGVIISSLPRYFDKLYSIDVPYKIVPLPKDKELSKHTFINE